MGRGILNGLVALLLVGTLVSPYVGGAVTAYVLIGLSLLLIIWNLFRPPRFAVDAGSWMFVGAWALIAVAFMLTNRPGSSDYLLSVNFAMFALYPLLAAALQRFAGPNNSARIAILALAGSFVALVLGAVQVFVQHYGRAEGYASNPIPSATVALFLGFSPWSGCSRSGAPGAICSCSDRWPGLPRCCLPDRVAPWLPCRRSG
jgi:hypothetical protein